MRHAADISAATFAALFSDPLTPALVNAYSAESKIDEMPNADLNVASYLELERVGAMKVFKAVYEGRLVGFLAVMVAEIPRYKGQKIATTESFYVDPAFRGYGTGLKLLEQAEAFAQASGATVFFVQMPTIEGVSPLAVMGYKKTHDVFCRALE